MTNGSVRRTSPSAATGLHHFLNVHTPPNDYFAYNDRGLTSDSAEVNGNIRKATSKMYDDGCQELDNKQNVAEAGLHDSDICNGARGVAWSNEEACQRSEVVSVEMNAGLTSDRAGDINEGDGRDGDGGDGDNCDLDAGW